MRQPHIYTALSAAYCLYLLPTLIPILFLQPSAEDVQRDRYPVSSYCYSVGLIQNGPFSHISPQPTRLPPARPPYIIRHPPNPPRKELFVNTLVLEDLAILLFPCLRPVRPD